MSDATEPKVEKTEAPAAAEEKPTSSSVFSMFGGGAKKEKKDEEERGDVSGSAKAQREAAEAAKAEGGDDVRRILVEARTWRLDCSEGSLANI